MQGLGPDPHCSCLWNGHSPFLPLHLASQFLFSLASEVLRLRPPLLPASSVLRGRGVLLVKLRAVSFAGGSLWPACLVNVC